MCIDRRGALQNFVGEQVFSHVQEYYASQGMGAEDKNASAQDVGPAAGAPDEEMKQENDAEEMKDADPLENW